MKILIYPISFIALVVFLTNCKKVEYKSECCTHEISIYPEEPIDSMRIWAPNAFTPNQDNINEVFKIYYHNVSSEDFFYKIYQNDQSFLETNDKNAVWNGVHNETLKEGVYSYYISGKAVSGVKFEAKGKFCLLIHDDGPNTTINNCNSCTFPDMINEREGFIFTTNELLEDCEDR